MILCGLIAAAILYLLWPLLIVPLDFLATRLSALPAWLIAVGALLIITLPASRMPFPRWCATLGLRHPLSHAPLAVAVLIGTAAIYWFDHTISAAIREGFAAVRSLPPEAWAYMLIAALAPPAAHLILKPEPKPKRPSASPDAPKTADDLLDFKKLTDWLAHDREVTHPDDDLFGHKDVAARIADRLINPKPNAPPDAGTIAVIGPIGSGKSTIRELTRYYLDHPGDIPQRTDSNNDSNHNRRKKPPLFVSLSLWPYDSSNAAVAGILNELFRALRDHINTLPLCGIQEQYLEAIDRAAGAWGGLSRLLRRTDSPEKVLESIDTIAAAIGIRITLWIEDLERFAGHTPLNSAAAPDHTDDKLGPIRSLLYLLNKTPSITVIVADTSLQSRFDVEKIARYIEHCPPIDKSHTEILLAFRNHCLDTTRFNFIDPRPQSIRRGFIPSNKPPPYPTYISERYPIMKRADNMLRVMQTPRRLKLALRHMHDVWSVLYGEIDFDEALIATVIRTSNPDLFAFIDSHIEALRDVYENTVNSGGIINPEDPLLTAEHNRILAQITSHRESGAYRALLIALFPGSNNAGSNQPQSFQMDGMTDYWKRYSSAAPIPKEKSDQALLQSIKLWREHKESDLVKRMMEHDSAQHVQSFSSVFQGDELIRLLREVVSGYADVPATDWKSNHAKPIVAVWLMCFRPQPNKDSLTTALLELVRDNSPTNLPLAHDLVYCFTRMSGNAPELIDADSRQALMQALQQSLAQIAEQDGAAGLQRAINGGSPYIVYWSSWGIDRIRNNEFDGLPFDGWHHVANALLDLIGKNPPLAVQQIAPMLTDSERSIDHRIHDSGRLQPIETWATTVNKERARRLFDNYDRLIRSLASVGDQEGNLETDDEQLNIRIRSLLQWAGEQSNSSAGNP